MNLVSILQYFIIEEPTIRPRLEMLILIGYLFILLSKESSMLYWSTKCEHATGRLISIVALILIIPIIWIYETWCSHWSWRQHTVTCMPRDASRKATSASDDFTQMRRIMQSTLAVSKIPCRRWFAKNNYSPYSTYVIVFMPYQYAFKSIEAYYHNYGQRRYSLFNILKISIQAKM